MPRSPYTVVSHRFRREVTPFSVTTSDGVVLRGSRVGTAEPAIVLCHGFMGWHRKPRVARFAEDLARWFTVYTVDLRGHGRSGGSCSFGDLEIHDVDAVLQLARDEPHGYVATIGASMGGIAVIRHAGLLGGPDAVVAISVPSRWAGHRTDAVVRMQRLTTTTRGRRMMRLAGVRLAETWNDPESPEDVVGKIAPTPFVVIHGRDDHYFDEEEAWRLYHRAGQPKRLLLASRFGHAEDGFTPALAERVARVLHELWGLPWPG